MLRTAVSGALVWILLSGQCAAAEPSEWMASAFRASMLEKSRAAPGKASRRVSALDERVRKYQGSRRRAGGAPSPKADPDEDIQVTRRVRGKAPEAQRAALPVRPQFLRGSGPWAWPVRHEAWTDSHEAGYEAFVRAIGESDCRTVDACLTSAVANPTFAVTNPPGASFLSDCADLPFLLRAYFAWRTGLPFSFPIRIAGHPPTGKSPPGQAGYQVTERFDVVGPGPDFRQLMKAVTDYVTSNYFRVPAHYRGAVLADHYPVRLDRHGIRAGTVVYDPDGHLAIVYKVTSDGRIHYIDAHPDNSLTRGVYGRDFVRTVPDLGGGFKRWRPQRLVGARKAADGTLIGGRIELVPDASLPDWSDEQFIALSINSKSSARGRSERDGRRVRSNEPDRSGGARRESQYLVDGRAVDYYDFLRLRLAPAGFRYDPLAETRARVRHLCDGLRDRVFAVDRAVEAGLARRPQPPRLPNNIYATQGDWELYSTPSRDARLKVGFEELRDEVSRFLALAAEASPLISYAGDDLARDLSAIYEEETAHCPITYRRSDGSTKVLSFEEVRRRLFRMSFDPHHCPERRWGAEDGAELVTCPDDATKRAWYAAQYRLRNQLVRTYGEPMGWSLADLHNPSRDIGQDDAPDIDVLAVLRAASGIATASTP